MMRMSRSPEDGFPWDVQAQRRLFAGLLASHAQRSVLLASQSLATGCIARLLQSVIYLQMMGKAQVDYE